MKRSLVICGILFCAMYVVCRDTVPLVDAVARPLVGSAAKPLTDTVSDPPSGAVTIPLSGLLSGSVYAHAGGETKVYFLTAHTGRLRVQLRGRAAQATSFAVKLDGGGHDAVVRLGAVGGAGLIDAGWFDVGEAGYHYISLIPSGKGVRLPRMSDMILSGPAAEGILYNSSEYKGAPATHLTYRIPGDSAAEWFYSEVSVPREADHSPNAYYETNGFDGGYMGIQLNSVKERRVIFSIWSNYNTNDPKEIPAEYAVRLIRKGKGVYTDAFGNEGSGGHSHLVFMWKAEDIIKLLVRAKAAGDHTIYTAWFSGPETGGWKLMAQWDKAKTGGALLSDLYSFVENFGDNGEDYFTARYGNQWICTPSGNWVELTQARFTTTAGAKHPRFDYGAGVVGDGAGQNTVGTGAAGTGAAQNTAGTGAAGTGAARNTAGTGAAGSAGVKEREWFYMYSGGFRRVNNLAPGSVIRRESVGVPPAVDLAALPEE